MALASLARDIDIGSICCQANAHVLYTGYVMQRKGKSERNAHLEETLKIKRTWGTGKGLRLFHTNDIEKAQWS